MTNHTPLRSNNGKSSNNIYYDQIFWDIFFVLNFSQNRYCNEVLSVELRGLCVLAVEKR